MVSNLCPAINNTDLAAEWSGQLVFDLVVFLLTTMQSRRLRKSGTRSITDILLRDGTSILLSLFLELTPVA